MSIQNTIIKLCVRKIKANKMKLDDVPKHYLEDVKKELKKK